MRKKGQSRAAGLSAGAGDDLRAEDSCCNMTRLVVKKDLRKKVLVRMA